MSNHDHRYAGKRRFESLCDLGVEPVQHVGLGMHTGYSLKVD